MVNSDLLVVSFELCVVPFDKLRVTIRENLKRVQVEVQVKGVRSSLFYWGRLGYWVLGYWGWGVVGFGFG